MLEIMDLMIVMFVVIGLILSAVVLYNLGVMSYSEKYRQMAMLKILELNDKKNSSLLITQNLWLSFFKIILGLPIGYFILSFLLDSMMSEYEFILTVTPLSYCVSIILNLALSFLVAFMLTRKNKTINMVEALKSVE